MHVEKRGYTSDIKKIGLIGVFSQVGLAAVTTIWAVYLESFLHNPSYVGFLTAIFMLIGTLTFIYGVPILEKYNKTRLYVIIILLFAISYYLFSIFSNIYIIIILGIITTILGSLRVSLYGVIVRDSTSDKLVSRNEGLIYTFMNLSWFITPIVAGYIASEFGVRTVFIFSAIMFLFSILFLRIFKVQDPNMKKKPDKKPLKLFLNYFKNRDRVFSYILGGGIDFWWVLIYIYIPIKIFESGLPDTTIGYFLGAVIVPLILIEYYVGKKAGKKGFKGIFITGYSILGFSALICFFIPNLYIILIILSLASFGAGMLEPTTEAYFFDIIKKDEREKFYSSYNTAIDAGSFFARAIAAVVLLILPFNFVFILFALVMGSLAFLSTKTKNIVEFKKKS